jgi:hypothetical protein
MASAMKKGRVLWEPVTVQLDREAEKVFSE